MADQIIVLLGTDNPQMQAPEFARGEQGEWHPTGLTRSVPAEHLTSSVTRVELQPEAHGPDGNPMAIHEPAFVEHTLLTDNDRQLWLIAKTLTPERRRWAVALQHLEQVVGVHQGGSRPAYVACNDPDLQRAVAEYFGCPQGEYQVLVTNGGRDAIHAQALGTAAQPAAFNFMALANSATAVAPAVTDTTLTGEITTVGGGLIRKQGTYAHTAGTNTTTITATFTANGTDALPVTVSQDALFNAITAGTMAFKDALNSNATFNVVGDNLTNTHTINIG